MGLLGITLKQVLAERSASGTASSRPIDRLAHWFKNFDPKFPMIYFFGAEPVDADEWLVHLTEDAQRIVREGFKHGAQWKKIGPQRFGFAFKSDDPGLRSAVDTGRYGPEGVLFTSDAAIEAFHEDDQEQQVVFQIEATENRHAVIKNDDSDEWEIQSASGEVLMSHSSFREVVRKFVAQH